MSRWKATLLHFINLYLIFYQMQNQIYVNQRSLLVVIWFEYPMLVVLYPARGSPLNMFKPIKNHQWLFISLIFDLLSRQEIKRYTSVFGSHAWAGEKPLFVWICWPSKISNNAVKTLRIVNHDQQIVEIANQDRLYHLSILVKNIENPDSHRD